MIGKTVGNQGDGGKVINLFGGTDAADRLFSRAMQLDGSRATWSDAERLYREVVRLDPGHWEAWNNLGVMAFKLGDKAAALEAWAEALRRNAHAAETFNNIGSLFQEERKFEVAAVYLRNAVGLDPEMSEARVNLAMVLQSLGRFRQALKHWRFYLKRWPRGESAELARKHEALCERASSA